MSASSARDLWNDGYEYRTEGSLALQRMQERYEARQAAFQADERVLAKNAARPKRKINAGNMVLLCILVFSFIMGFLYMQTQIQQNNIEISALKKELTSVQKEANDLELQIVMADDIDEVRAVATGDFGMSSAGEGQVVKVALPHNDAQVSAAAMANGK